MLEAGPVVHSYTNTHINTNHQKDERRKMEIQIKALKLYLKKSIVVQKARGSYNTQHILPLLLRHLAASEALSVGATVQ